jgi:hypothetical protein
MEVLMRALAIATLLLGGCSLFISDNDLHGTGSGGDGFMPGDGGRGNDGPPGPCTPRATVKFTVTMPTVAASSPFTTALSDIDKDGKVDIVTANYGSNNFSVLLGGGDGTFALAPTAPFMSCTNPINMAVRDVTGDGLDDIVITCWDTTNAAAQVYVNQSTPGSVKFATEKMVGLSAQASFFPLFGKFDTSNHVGLVLIGNNNVYRYTGDGTGAFVVASTIPAGMGAESGVAGKLNNDEVDDIIVYNYTDDDMTMLLSQMAGGYAASKLAFDTTAVPPAGTLYFASAPILVDVNGDQLPDIVTASGTTSPGNIIFFKNTGMAAAPAFPVTGMPVPIFDSPLNVAMADFNCDGKLDIAAFTNGCDPTLGETCDNGPEPSVVGVMPAHGAGFDPAQTTMVPRYCDNLLVADFNGDGYNDIACGSGGGAINVLLNTP